MSAVSLHTLPGYADAPRIWRQVGPQQRVRIVDPAWIAEANANARKVTEAVEQREAARERRWRAWFATANAAVLSAEEVVDPPVRFVGYQPTREIIERIAASHGVSAQEVVGPRRKAKVTIARHHAMYEVSRLRTNLSTVQIGRIFGGRDHSTIIHAVQRWPSKAAALGIECEPIRRGGAE